MEASGGQGDTRQQAVESLKAKQGFKAMLLAYVVVNAALVVVWALSGEDYFWPIWVIGGWGIGVLITGYNVYFRKPITESDIQRERQRLGE